MKFSAHIERWPAIRPFRITAAVWNTFDSVVVELARDGYVGRGEALGVYYQEETVEQLMRQIELLESNFTTGIDRSSLLTLLPPGGARNAIDCALWDLEAKTTGQSIWRLTGIAPKSLETVLTIGIEATPSAMADRAAAAEEYQFLKVKLDNYQPIERLKAIRSARPSARIVVDANQGWTFDQLCEVAPVFAALGVEMIEQPLPRGGDLALETYESPVPLCADESCLHGGELAMAANRYAMINIKLDKSGGLTHAIELARDARSLGLGIMVGCMGGSSLAMAPAFVLGCLADLVDIDGPLLQKTDRLPGLVYQGGKVSVFDSAIWG